MNGIELEQREFFAAIRDKREPNAGVQQALYSMEVLHRMERRLTA